ncbi:MAG TPA: ATP-binding cassette domain-containing protein [Candidatus Angelobacter sp.]|nr:ATP-binding cassette domain-containing protein [Candidatus Angelobacter sp.]
MNALAVPYPLIEPQRALDVRLSKRYATSKHPGFRLETKFTALPGVTVVLGHSGAGKSTLLRCIAGLCDPELGRIAIGERVLFDSNQKINLGTAARNIGFVFQDLALFPHLTVQDNVGYGLHRLNAAEREHRMASILESFHIAHLRKRLPRETSGGEQQRVALARSLVTEPCILLLDEPLSSLDTRMKANIIEDLRRWTDERRIPILYVTHDHEEAFALGEHALALHQGQVVAEGPPREVASTPGREFRKHASGFENLLDATIVALHEEEETMTCRIAEVGCEMEIPLAPVEPGVQVRLGIRSADILLAAARPEMLGGCNVIGGRIQQIDPEGAIIIVRVDSGVDFKVRLPRTAKETAGIALNDQAWLIIRASSCSLLHAKHADTSLVGTANGAGGHS